jgi:hypothetical protein
LVPEPKYRWSLSKFLAEFSMDIALALTCIYYNTTPESRNSGTIADVHYQATDRWTHSHGNKYASNNRRVAVSMQQRGKHASLTIEELLLGSGVFCGGQPEAI